MPCSKRCSVSLQAMIEAWYAAEVEQCTNRKQKAVSQGSSQHVHNTCAIITVWLQASVAGIFSFGFFLILPRPAAAAHPFSHQNNSLTRAGTTSMRRCCPAAEEGLPERGEWDSGLRKPLPDELARFTLPALLTRDSKHRKHCARALSKGLSFRLKGRACCCTAHLTADGVPEPYQPTLPGTAAG
eukprot:1159443-Pelagomonas_calceolata.AAC.6